MHRSGIEFGSHTATHPILSRVEPEKLEREILTSRARIEEELGTTVHALSYPVGSPPTYNEQVKAALARAGYAFGVSTVWGPNHPGQLDPYALRRIPVDLDLTFTLLRCYLAAPEFFGRRRSRGEASA
jgi:peptidoglycan/xylan/chitin deacetylase (PgdA/CDA1 family)